MNYLKRAQLNRKQDLIAIQDNRALLLDAQVVGGSTDLGSAHKRDILVETIKLRYNTTVVQVNTMTLNNRGEWIEASASFLAEEKCLKEMNLK